MKNQLIITDCPSNYVQDCFFNFGINVVAKNTYTEKQLQTLLSTCSSYWQKINALEILQHTSIDKKDILNRVLHCVRQEYAEKIIKSI